MTMESVTSSQVAAIGHENTTLHVKFIHGNATYEYDNVPWSVYKTLLDSHSIGKDLARLIKAHPETYPYRKL